MRMDGSGREARPRSWSFGKGTIRTLALFTLGLLAQAAIVAFAPEGKAQARVPPRTPPILPISVTTFANAIGDAGELWSPKSIVETGPGISATRVAAELIGEGSYADVFAPGGELVRGKDGKTISITFPALSPSEPLVIQPSMFIGGFGILQQQVQIGITETAVFTNTLVAPPTSRTIDLFYGQPSLIQPGVISATWGVGALSTAISRTIVTGRIEGGVYADIVSDRGLCDVTISGFSCSIDPLAAGDFGLISVTLETLKAPLMSQVINLESGSDSLVYTYTTTVQGVSTEPPEPRPVAIDVKPGNRRNIVNTRSNGLLRVAILSELSFDVVAEVDQPSLRFGRTGSEDSVAFCMSRDENRDGLTDLRCFVHIPSTGLRSGDTEAILTGFTVDGTPILGSDSILTVPRRRR